MALCTALSGSALGTVFSAGAEDSLLVGVFSRPSHGSRPVSLVYIHEAAPAQRRSTAHTASLPDLRGVSDMSLPPFPEDSGHLRL